MCDNIPLGCGWLPKAWDDFCPIAYFYILKFCIPPPKELYFCASHKCVIISLRVADGCPPEAAESADPFHLRPFILRMTMMTILMMMDNSEFDSNGKSNGKEDEDFKKESFIFS